MGFMLLDYMVTLDHIDWYETMNKTEDWDYMVTLEHIDCPMDWFSFLYWNRPPSHCNSNFILVFVYAFQLISVTHGLCMNFCFILCCLE